MKTKNKIIEELLEEAKTIASNFSWVPKTPQADILTASSLQFWSLHVLIEYIKSISGFDYFSDITATLRSNLKTVLNLTDDELDTLLENDLDNLADLWGFTRIAEVVAHGSFRFVFSSANPVTINEGITIRSPTGIDYKTTQTLSLTPTNKGDGYLSIDILCESEESGIEGNVAEDTYFELVDTSITGFSFAFPIYDIDNGVNKETDANFITRIQNNRAQRGVPSTTWLTNKLAEDPRVYDSKIVVLGDENFYRSYGADVWICAEEIPVTQEEDFITDSFEGVCAHILKKVPLINKDPIISYPDGIHTYTLTEFDSEGHEYGGSIDAIVYIAWNGGCGVNGGTMSYKYDSTIEDLQEMLVDPEYWILGGRDIVLIKKAFGKYIDLNVRIKVESGYIFEDVKANVQHDLFVFIYGGLASGGTIYARQTFIDEIQKSDMLDVMLDSKGVDQVNVSLFRIKFSDSSDWTQETLEFEYNQYPEMDVSDADSVVIEEMTT